MVTKIIAFISFIGLMSVNVASAQEVESVILKTGESTRAKVYMPTGVRQYLEAEYFVHCSEDVNAARVRVGQVGGIAIGPNNSVIVEDKNLTRRNHSVRVKEISCEARPKVQASLNSTNVALRSNLPTRKPKPVLPKIKPSVVWSNRHSVPEFEVKNNKDFNSVAFTLHCSRSASIGINDVTLNGGISITEGSLVVIEDKFHKQSDSVNNAAVVSCERQPKDVIDVISTVE